LLEKFINIFLPFLPVSGSTRRSAGPRSRPLSCWAGTSSQSPTADAQCRARTWPPEKNFSFTVRSRVRKYSEFNLPNLTWTPEKKFSFTVCSRVRKYSEFNSSNLTWPPEKQFSFIIRPIVKLELKITAAIQTVIGLGFKSAKCSLG